MATELATALRRLEGLRKPVVAAVHGPRARAPGSSSRSPATRSSRATTRTRSSGCPRCTSGLMPAGNGIAARRGPRGPARRDRPRRRRRRACAPRRRGRSASSTTSVRAPSSSTRRRGTRRRSSGTSRASRDERGDLHDAGAREEPDRAAPPLQEGARAGAAKTRRALRGAGARARRPRALRRRQGLRRRRRALEAKSFGDLVVSETAHRLIELSLATAALERDPGSTRRPRRGPIAPSRGPRRRAHGRRDRLRDAPPSGDPVRLKEKDDAAVGRALRGVEGAPRRARRPRRAHARSRASRSSRASRRRPTSRACATPTPSSRRCPRTSRSSRRSCARSRPLVGPQCVYASNTSSIPIAKIAQGAARPRARARDALLQPRAPTMPLLEVVRADKTAPWAVATAVALGKRQGKTVIVVKDGPGFYTTRILAPLLNEAIQLVSDGVPAERDRRGAGRLGVRRSGPIARLDEMGIDVASHVAQGLHAAFGARMTPPGRARDARRRRPPRAQERARHLPLRRAPAARPREARRSIPACYALLGVAAADEAAGRRDPACGARWRWSTRRSAASATGSCAIPRDGDVGAIFGLGFPRVPRRSVPLRRHDRRGRRAPAGAGYADRFGERWRPAPLLVQMAKKGERFFA